MSAMPQSSNRDYSRRWGFRKLRLRAKLLLSIGILGIGYLLVIGLVQWTSTTMQLHLRTASQSLFPAALAAQQAEADFLKLNKDYKDAAVAQDTGALPLVNGEAQEVASELSAFKSDTLDNADLQSQVIHLQEEFAAFSQSSKAASTKLLSTRASVSADRMLTIQTQAGGNEKIAAALAKLGEDVSKKYFQAEVSLVGHAIDRERYLTCILFVVVFTLAALSSFILEREISVPLGRAIEALDSMAAGDLTLVLHVQAQDEMGLMGSALNRAREHVRATLNEVALTAAAAGEFSKQLTTVAGTIASGTQQQANGLQSTTASLEKVTAAARQNAGSALKASKLASTSEASAERGQEVVSKAIAAMEEIKSSSARISDILSDIDEIAFQTNLLAVNAAVEAARAGDEGRGFAVVASEVRALAQRSAAAAKEIKALIQDSLSKVEHGSAMVNLSGESLQSIFSSVKVVTSLVGEIALASEEQRTGIEQVTSSMALVDHVTQSNLARTEELSEMLHVVNRQSETLMELTDTFTLGEVPDRKLDLEEAAAEESFVSITGDDIAPWNEDGSSNVYREKSHGTAVQTEVGRRTGLSDFSATRRQVQNNSVALVSTGEGGVITRNQILPGTPDDDSFEEF